MDLLRLLSTNENSRKVFGKRELRIIEKQLLGVRLSQSEKNRLSRDIRKKLLFIKEAAAFADEFRLRKGAVIGRLVTDAQEAILEDTYSKGIRRIVLFGSAAEGALTLRSDIDLAVEFFSCSLNEATAFRKRVLGKVDPRIDVQVYNHLSAALRQEIDRKGKVLYSHEA